MEEVDLCVILYDNAKGVGHNLLFALIDKLFDFVRRQLKSIPLDVVPQGSSVGRKYPPEQLAELGVALKDGVLRIDKVQVSALLTFP